MSYGLQSHLVGAVPGVAGVGRFLVTSRSIPVMSCLLSFGAGTSGGPSLIKYRHLGGHLQKGLSLPDIQLYTNYNTVGYQPSGLGCVSVAPLAPLQATEKAPRGTSPNANPRIVTCESMHSYS